MIGDLVDSTTLIIIGACVTVGLLVSCCLLGVAALISAVVAAARRLIGRRTAQASASPDATPHAATGAHTGTQSPIRPRPPEAT